MIFSLPIMIGIGWAIFATIVALVPAFRFHRVMAIYVLIPTALIILPWLFYEEGAIIGLLALAAVGSILRWPIYYLSRWVLKGIPPNVPRTVVNQNEDA